MPSAKQVRMRRGTTLENDMFTGPEGEVTVDTTVKTLRVHDGVTLGGNALALADLSNVNESTLATLIQEIINASGPGGEGEPMAIGDMKMSYAAQDPAEFHRADGAALSKTEYAELYGVIGDRYNLMGVGASPYTYSSVTSNNAIYDMATDGTNTVALMENGVIWHTLMNGATKTVNLPVSAVAQRIFYHSGKFFVFAAGTTYSSSDGLTWTSSANSFPAAITSTTSSNITYSNGRFIACYGTTAPFTGATSSDGINWTPFSTTAFAYTTVNTSYYSARLGLYIIFGQTGLVATSSDGTTWTARVTTTTANFAIKYVAENSSTIVASGTLSASVPAVQTSSDGVTWTNRTPIASVGTYAVAWSPSVSRFYVGCASGQSAYSSDGVTWTSQTAVVTGLASSATFVHVAADDNGTYFVGDNGSVSSLSSAPSGSTTFTSRPNGSGNKWYSRIMLDSTNGLAWLYSMSGVTNRPNILVSADGGVNTYLVYTAMSANVLASRKYASSLVVGGSVRTIAITTGQNPIFTATVYTDGQGRNHKFLMNTGVGYPTCATAANGLFVVGGQTGMTSTSTDGLNWTASFGMPASEIVVSIKYNGSIWLAITHTGVVCTSPDAATWNPVAQILSTQGTASSWIVTWTGNRWIVSNGSTAIAHSVDAENWSTASFPTTVSGFAEGNGRVVVTTASTTATYSSTDLVSWTASSTPPGTTVNRGIAFGNGQFVIGGGDTATSGTTVANAVMNTSPDGITWSQTKLDGRGTIKDVIFSDGFFFAYGTYSNGISSMNLTSTSVYSSQDGFRWSLCGADASNTSDGITGISGYGYHVFGTSTNFMLLLPEEGYFRLPLKVASSSTDGDYYIKIADPE